MKKNFLILVIGLCLISLPAYAGGEDLTVTNPAPATVTPVQTVTPNPATMPAPTNLRVATSSAPAQSITVPAGATLQQTINVYCGGKPCEPEKPKAVVKPKAKKKVVKKPAPTVVTPAPVAEAIGRFEKQIAGPCGSGGCPPPAKIITGAARFEMAPGCR